MRKSTSTLAIESKTAGFNFHRKHLIITSCVMFCFLLSFNSFSQTLVSENFEGATFPPAGWSVINAGSGNVWVRSTSTSSPVQFGTSTAYMVYNYNASFAANTWAFTPTISLTAGTQYVVQFVEAASGFAEKLKVTIGNGQTVAAQTTTLLSFSDASSDTYTTRTQIFTVPTSGTYNLGFNCFSVADEFNFAVDEIKVRVAVFPNAAPVSFTTSAVTQTGMTIGWTDASTNETAFRVYRSTDNVNFTQVGSDITSTSSASTGTTYSSVQTGLTPGITYYYRIAAVADAESSYLTGNQVTTGATTYFYTGAAIGDIATAANWNTLANGTGSLRTTPLTTDILIVDGAGTTAGAAVTLTMAAAATIGALQITSNTAATLQSTTTTTRALILTGSTGNELDIAAGSSLSVNNATQAATIAFSTGSGMTGSIAGTLNLGGSASNLLTTTGGTGTVVTVQNTGVVNLANSTVSLVGSAATLSFANGSICNASGSTTTAAPVPLATWGTSSNLVISGLTTATAAPANNTQSFGNLTINCPASSAIMAMFAATTTGVIKGNLLITATGTGRSRLVTTGTLNITGNVTVNAGTLEIASGAGTVNVTGSFNVNGGTADLTSNTATAAATLKLAGNFNQTGGTLNESGTTTASSLEFNGTSAQNLTVGTVGTGPISVRVNNANGVILAGILPINSGAGLTISSGNITGSGTISYNAASGKLIYNSATNAQTANSIEFPAVNGPASLVINNTNASPNNIVAIPFSRVLGTSGVLTLTAGIVNNTGNSLTLLNTATAALAGGSATSYVKGTVIRTLPASLATGSTYTFPVGKSSYNPFELVNPVTNAGGTVTAQAEVADANSGGTPGILMGSLNTSRYWIASLNGATAANFTGSLIRLNDTRGVQDAIAASATLTGSYDHIGGTASTLATTSITSTAPAITSLPGFFLMGNLAAATLSNLVITPAGNQCTNIARTVTITATPGGAPVTGVAISYQVNGGTVVNVNMTNTSGNDWSGTIPTVTPSNGTVTWSVTATDGNGLVKTATGTSYNDEPNNGVSAIATVSPGSVCAGGPVTLSVSLLKGGTPTFGAGASTTTNSDNSSGTYISPFSHYFGGYKAQYLIKASEITALGFGAGSVNGMAFNVVSAGTTYNSFTISMANTSTAAMTATFISTGLSQVYTADYTPTVGTNMINFSNSFAWNGTSNLLIQICWSNNNTGGAAAEVKYDAPGFAAMTQDHEDSELPSDMCGITTGTKQNNRPQIKLSFNSAPVATGYSWSDGTSVVGTSNPQTANPSVNTTYTATVTALGCPIVSNGVSVTAIALPNPPNATSSSQCGTGVPSAFVTTGGANGTYKWYDAQTGGNLIQNGGSTYTGSISTTTTFWVSESNGTCESLRAQITAAVVAPDAIHAVAGNTNPCVNTSIQLSASNVAATPVNNYSFSWTALPVSGSGLPSSVPGSSISVTPVAAGTYKYIATAVDGSCTTTDTVIVTVKALPVIASAVAAPAAVCSGLSSTLTALTNNVSAGTATLGTGTTTYTSSAFPSIPYANYDEGGNGEILVKASELTAAGLHAGNITSLAFNVANLNASGTHKGFTIKIKQTALTSLSTFDLTAMTTVFGPVNYQPVAGINTHNFTTAFNWDGSANLLIDICFDNEPTATGGTNYTNNALNFYTATSFNSIVYYNADGVGAVRDMCGAPAGVTAGTSRPNMVFGGQVNSIGAGTLNYVWNPGALTGSSVTVAPAVTTTYTVTATDPATTCSNNQNVTLTIYQLPPAPSGNGSEHCGSQVPTASVSSNSGASTPVFRWYDAATGGTLLQSGTSTTYNSPVSVTTDFYVAELSAQGCEGARAQVTVNVISADPVSAASSLAAVCLGGTIDLTATQQDFNNTYQFSWTATSSGSGISGTATGNPLNAIMPTATGIYIYTVTAFDVDKGCQATSSVTVTVNGLPVIDSARANPTTVCSGNPSVLNVYSGVIASGPQTVPSGYLASNATNTSDEDILNVSFGTLNNTSTCSTTGGSGSILNEYSNYTATVSAPTLTAGNTVPVSVQVGTCGGSFSNWTNVFIDYNRNGSFEANERVYTSTGSPTGAHFETGNISIPSTATAGVTLMRVIVVEFGSATDSPTGTYSWGETEDYLVNIRSVITQNPAYTYTWTPGPLSGSTVTVSPVNTTTYNVIATDGNGCSSNPAAVTVTATPLPAAPTASNSTQCGLHVPTASVSGGPGTFKWYSAATGGTLLQTGGSTYTTAINATTTFYVSLLNGSCESVRTPVTVTVTQPDPVSTGASSNSVCPNIAIQLTSANTAASPSNNYTYTWTASPSAGSGIPSSVTGSTVSVTPTTAGTYTYTVTANDGGPSGCTITGTVTVTVNPNPVIASATATPNVVCANGASVLSATTNVISAGTSASIGTATTLTTAAGVEPTAFNNRYSQYWSQSVYTAAELNAAGLYAGNITALNFNVSTLGSEATNANFSVKIGTTAGASVSAFVTTGLTNVYGPATYTHVVGSNTITFDNPYTWDGTSNILIDIRQDGSDETNNARTYYTATAANTIITAITSTTSATTPLQTLVQNSSVTPSLSVKRLNLILSGQVNNPGPGNLTWVWNPGNLSGSTVTVHPAITTSYTVTGTNPVTGCSATSAPLTVTVTPLTATASATPASVCAGGTVALSAVASGGTPFTYSWSDGTAVVGTTNPLNVNPTVTTTYTITVTDACGNTVTSPVTVIVNPLPTSSIAEAGPISICAPATQVLTAVTNASSPAYQWQVGGVNISGATSSTYTVTASGSYTVIVTSGSTGCVSAASAAVVVTINAKPSAVTVTPASSTICNGTIVTLNASVNTVSAVSGTGAATTVGNTTAATLGPNPLQNYYGGVKQQMLYRASELAALGMGTGSVISAIKFNLPTADNTLALQNLRVKMKATTTTTLTTTWEAGLTVVRTAASYTPVVGINTLTLTTPVTWDGVNNIVIEVTYSNNTSGTTGSVYNTAKYSPTSFASTIFYVADLTTANALNTYTGAVTNAYSSRNDLTFDFSNPGTIKWAPLTGLYSNAAATTAYTGAVAATVYAKPAATTTYTATATSTAGCTNASTAVITVNPRPTAVISGTTSYCNGQSTTTNLSIAVTGAGPWSGTITDGTTTTPFSGSTSPISVTVTPTVTTTYTIATLNGAQCSAIAADLSGSATVTINPRPTGVISGSGTYCNGANTATVLSIAVTGAGPWSGTLSDGTTFSGTSSPISVTVTPTATTTYTIATLNGAQCSASTADLSGSATVTINPRPTGVISGSGTYCNGANTATVLSIAVTGAGPWSGTLSNGATFSGSTNPISVTVTPTVTTTYTIATLNGAQCSAIAADLSGSATVTINPRPTGVISGSGTYCNGANTATVLSIAVTGAGPWSGTLSDGTTFSGATSPISVTVTPTATTTYTISTLNGAQCSAITADLSGSATVTINPRPTGVISGSGTYCNGANTATVLSIAVTGTGPWSGTLSDGTTFSGTTSPISVTVTPTATTTYTIATLNGAQCSASTADLSGSATVTINPRPTGVISGSGTYCNGANTATVLSIAVTGAGPWSGTLSDGTTFSGTTSPVSVTVTPTATTTYTIATLNGAQCSAIAADLSGSATVTINPRPTGVISGSGTYCSGANTATVLSIAVTGAGPWSGTLSDGTTFSGSTSPISVTVTPTTTTTYTIATLVGSACSSIAADLSGSATVTVNPLAANVTATVSQPTCTVATGTITVTAPLGSGTTYSLDGGTYQSSVTFSGVAPGMHSLTAQTSSGCFSPASTSVTVNPQPFTPSAPTVTGIVNVCPYVGTGQHVTYTANAAGATSYNWTIPPTNVTIFSGQGTNTLVVIFNNGFSQQGNQQIRVTATSSCGTSAQTLYVLVAQYPTTPNPITGPTNICPLIGTSTTATYSIPASPAAISYNWTVPGLTITAAQGQNTTSITFTYPAGYTASGPITVVAANNCGTSGTRSLTLSAQPASQPGLITGPSNVCENIAPNGTAATYSITPVSGATSYTWTVSGVSSFTGQGTASISFTYPAGYTSGSVSVTATNGCGTGSARTLAISRLNPATPSNIDVINTVSCPNRQYTYTLASMPANATSIQWTIPANGSYVSGQGTTSITVSYPATSVNGTVTAQAINNCGLSTIRSVAVKLPACPSGFARVDESFTKGTVASPESMEVKIFPNPTVSDFKLEVLTAGKEEINVRVLNDQGKLFKTFKVMPYQTIALGAELKAGAYLVEVRQGREVRTTKLIKF